VIPSPPLVIACGENCQPNYGKKDSRRQKLLLRLRPAAEIG